MAQQLITLASAPANLMPGAMAMVLDYNLWPTEWEEIYTIVDSIKKTEYYYEYASLNAAGYFQEGQNIPQGVEYQVFTTRGDNIATGVGFTITSFLLEDNLYPDQFPKGIMGIKNNLQTFTEFRGIAPFDNAFAPQTNPAFIYGDSQPLCSAVHPLASGTIANTLQNAQLSLSSYQELIILVQQFQNYSGEPRKIMPTHLLSGINNEFEMATVTGSEYNPTNANNAINPILSEDRNGPYIRGKYVVSHFMSNPYNYFLLTDYEDGAIYQKRTPLRIMMSTDQNNMNVSINGFLRDCFTFPNWRCVAGVQSYN